MPEGPSIIILKEAVKHFKRRKIIRAVGTTTKIDLDELKGQTIMDFKTWGKHFLICFPEFTIRIHLLMFGKYSVNEERSVPPKLGFQFSNGEELNFYACGITRIDEPLKKIYDWSSDVMSRKFDSKKALMKLKRKPNTLVCDAILDQDIFSGAGNIFKNEVLYRIKVHPLSKVGNMPQKKRSELVKEVLVYGKDFLKWKRKFVLKKHFEAYTKKKCKRDGNTFIKEYLGRTKRRSFFCGECQVKY